MTSARPKVLLLTNQQLRNACLLPPDLKRLNTFADWEWLACDGEQASEPNKGRTVVAQLLERVGDVDGIVTSLAAPKIDTAIMDRAPKLRIIGHLDGDRFADNIAVEAAWERGIRLVDTTNGSSYAVAEWALALIIISLRNAGAHFRHILAGDCGMPSHDDPGFLHGELMGKRVGLIGCGHIGRLLLKLLWPFKVDIRVYDPYLPKETVEALGVLQTSLEYVLSQSDVIVCLAPLTPATRGMIGQRELDLIPSGAILVNVSRGAIIDSNALIARLKHGDIIAGLDVFDPEPIPGDSEIIRLPNVFLSPHIAGVTANGGVLFFKLMVDELDRFFHNHETLFDLTPRSLANRRGVAPPYPG